MSMAYETLKYELADGIATVTINRPEKNNAISLERRADFRALADDLYADEGVRVAVFTGTGKTFCVGADVSTFETDWNTPVFRANTRLLTSFFNDLEALEKPLIAAINGTCVGGGLELALACDLRITARSARFGLPENNLGLIPGIGGCSRLVKLVGFGRAKELVLTGEIIAADEALRVGLVNRVVDDAELASEARALARGPSRAKGAEGPPPVGPPAPSESYLAIDKLVRVAKAAGADAVHPGYGFLAENAAFAEACAAAGLVFIGPPPPAIRALGDKTAARRLARAMGVPLIPRTLEPVADDAPARGAAREIGYPLMIKAVMGGGGKGMRVVRQAPELEGALRAARSEAGGAFGDSAGSPPRHRAPARPPPIPGRPRA